MDKVSGITGTPWSITAVDKLKDLWNAGVSAEMISQTLGREEHEVRAKAGELGLPQHVPAK
jgi:hypothetical protein